MFQLTDSYKDQPAPFETIAEFRGGPFDGKKTKITVKKVLDSSVSIVMRDKSIYRFQEPYIFVFDGYQTPPEPEPEPTFKQKLVQRFLKWMLS